MRGLLRALAAGFTVELPASGGSMAPLLCTGDWLRVGPIDEAALRVGDVVVRQAAHGFVAHRVVSLAPLRTRGDAMPGDDAYEAADGALVGLVIARRRGARWLPLDGLRARVLGLAGRASVPARTMLQRLRRHAS
jgi:hypothetical protein